MSSVWFEGVDDLNSLAVELTSAAGTVGARAALVLRKTAADIEADSKAFAPVDTGNLRNSISTTFDGDGRNGAMTADIGPTASYGGYVEWGTARHPPQAYMGPAADRRGPQFEAGMAKAGEEVL